MKQESKIPKTDRLIGLSAMIISLLTLIIFIYQTHLIRQQARLSVEPRLQFSTDKLNNYPFKTFRQILINKGLGPAIIYDPKIIYQNKNYDLDFAKFTKDKFPESYVLCYTIQTYRLGEGHYMLPKDTVVLFRYTVQLERDPECSENLNFDTKTEDPRWDIELTYSSIYKDVKWRLNLSDNTPIVVK